MPARRCSAIIGRATSGELRNALERAAILCEGGLIGPEHLALEGDGQAAGLGVHRPQRDRATDHRAGAGRVPLEQDTCRQAPRPHAHAAVSSAAEVWTREAAGRIAQHRRAQQSYARFSRPARHRVGAIAPRPPRSKTYEPCVRTHRARPTVASGVSRRQNDFCRFPAQSSKERLRHAAAAMP